MDNASFGRPLDVRPLFGDERRALLEVLGSLKATQWQQPTACPGWTIADIAAHVLGDDLGRVSRQRDGFRGITPAPGESLLGFINRTNGEWVVAARRLSPELLTEMLRITGAWIVDLWDQADLGALGEPVSWAGRGPAPVWLDLARDFTEYWTHQQQIREAIHWPLLDDPRFLGPALDTFLRALPFTLSDHRSEAGTRAALRVDGPAGGTWTVERTVDRWVFVAPEDGAATTVVLDPDTTWRLCTRAISPEQARSRALIQGDLRLANAMLHIVSVLV